MRPADLLSPTGLDGTKVKIHCKDTRGTLNLVATIAQYPCSLGYSSRAWTCVTTPSVFAFLVASPKSPT